MSEQCRHEETWFDRTLCPEPCGDMHYICEACLVVVDYCALEDAPLEAAP